MIYFDNAATGGFKPNIVKESVKSLLDDYQVNVGRGSYDTAVFAEERVFECRRFLSNNLNNGHIGRLLFTANCTQALNFCVFGFKGLGSEIVTTVTEHNSVLRPIYKLAKDKNMTIRFAKPENYGGVKAESVLNLVNDKTAFVIMNAVSNVTGYKNQFEEVGQNLKGKIPFFVDGAQAGGHINFDIMGDNISALSLAGHKGLYAYQGVGVLAINKNYDLEPTNFGGSGTETFSEVPFSYPEKLEAGTLNYPAICSLYHGAKFAFDNMAYHNERLIYLSNRLIGGLSEIKGIKIYSEKNPYGIVSFAAECPSQILADVLGKVYKIAVRGGFHCAPLMHKHLKTDDNGLIRLSLSPFNTEDEIDCFLNHLPDAMSLCL